jgi:sugar-specific transcriptional regulator TrmB
MIEETLRKIGLTEYEIKIYLAMLRYGIIGAVELAKKSGVPFGKIYDVLYSLELKVFIKVVLGRPKKFSPIRPEIVLKVWFKKKEEELDSFKKEMETAEKELSRLVSKEKNPIVWMVRGEPNIKPMRIKAILEAEKEYYGIISPDVTTGPIPGLDKIVKEKIKKGITFRWIENPTTEIVREKIKAKIAAGAEIRYGTQINYNLTITDSKSIMIEMNDPNYGRTSLIIENPNLAKEWENFFNYKWKQSKS